MECWTLAPIESDTKHVSSAFKGIIGQHNKQGLFCGSLRRLSRHRVLNLFFFFVCFVLSFLPKQEVFFQKLDGGSEIFGGLHPFLQKKMSRIFFCLTWRVLLKEFFVTSKIFCSL